MSNILKNREKQTMLFFVNGSKIVSLPTGENPIRGFTRPFMNVVDGKPKSRRVVFERKEVKGRGE